LFGDYLDRNLLDIED